MNINAEEITRRISSAKANAGRRKKQKPDSSVIFRFENRHGDFAEYEPEDIPSAEILIEEFGTDSLSMTVLVDGQIRTRKALYETAQPQPPVQTAAAPPPPVQEKNSDEYIREILRTSAENQEKFMILIKQQSESAAADLKSQYGVIIDNLLKVSAVNQSGQEISFKTLQERSLQEFEEMKKNFRNTLEEQAKFQQEMFESKLEMNRKISELEIEKIKEVHKIQIERSQLRPDKMTSAEWLSLIREGLPEVAKSFRDIVETYRTVQDINIKAVN